jgi:hypothetical protein
VQPAEDPPPAAELAPASVDDPVAAGEELAPAPFAGTVAADGEMLPPPPPPQEATNAEMAIAARPGQNRLVVIDLSQECRRSRIDERGESVSPGDIRTLTMSLPLSLPADCNADRASRGRFIYLPLPGERTVRPGHGRAHVNREGRTGRRHC